MSKSVMASATIVVLGVLALLLQVFGGDKPLVEVTIEQKVVQEAPSPPPPPPATRCEEIEGKLPRIGEVVEITFYLDGVVVKKVWATVKGTGLDYGIVGEVYGYCADLAISYPSFGEEEMRSDHYVPDLLVVTNDGVHWFSRTDAGAHYEEGWSVTSAVSAEITIQRLTWSSEAVNAQQSESSTPR